MKEIIQGLLLFSALAVVSFRSDADTVHDAIRSNFELEPALQFINYESILPSHAGDFGGIKYLVIDFEPLRTAQLTLQPAIHRACQKILNDIPLLTQLSVEGYNMVSVSFDRQHQYDCL